MRYLADILADLSLPYIITLSHRDHLCQKQAELLLGITIPEEPRKIVLTAITHDILSVECFTQKQAFTTSFRDDNRGEVIGKLCALPFKQILIQQPERDTIILQSFRTNTERKKQTIRTAPASRKQWSEHHKFGSSSAERSMLITPQNSGALLRALGITDRHDMIIPAMSDKFRQINHFLSIVQSLDYIRQYDHASDTPLRIMDCGCGKAYLSLALYHWFNMIFGIKVELLGIDTNPQVIQSCMETAQILNFDSARFVCMPIRDVGSAMGNGMVANAYDLVIALHACDTATDEALYIALQAQAQAILSAPCCHHYVNAAMRSQEFKASAPHAVSLLLRDGITRERFADLLTDSLRRDILFGYGYRAELIEFTAPEHTLKNIMIRAERTTATIASHPDRMKRFHEEYTLWHTAPKLAELLHLV